MSAPTTERPTVEAPPTADVIELRPRRDARAFRDLFGQFPSGVCVITTAGGAGTAGMTASSVCSLSLDPMLLVVCIANRAGTLGVIQRNGRFAVNLLRGDQAAISSGFAARKPWAEKFAGVRHELVAGSPVLTDALGWLACRTYSSFACGDHTIVVGEVLDLHRGEGQPLVWQSGAYRRLGGEVA